MKMKSLVFGLSALASATAFAGDGKWYCSARCGATHGDGVRSRTYDFVGSGATPGLAYNDLQTQCYDIRMLGNSTPGMLYSSITVVTDMYERKTFFLNPPKLSEACVQDK